VKGRVGTREGCVVLGGSVACTCTVKPVAVLLVPELLPPEPPPPESCNCTREQGEGGHYEHFKQLQCAIANEARRREEP